MPDLIKWSHHDVEAYARYLPPEHGIVLRESWIAARHSGGANDNVAGNLALIMLTDIGVPHEIAQHTCGMVDLTEMEIARDDARRAAKDRSEGLPQDLPQLSDGATFILDRPPKPEIIWGEGDSILWAEGQALMIAGPQGLGKTTLAGLLVRGLLTGDDVVLGRPVVDDNRSVLYLAMDRPTQAAQSLRRQLGGLPRNLLADRLTFWEGPPPGDLAQNGDMLAELASRANADVIIVDSLKDAAVGLVNDDIGARWNRARQKALAEGIQMLELHHIRKHRADGDNEAGIDAIYGSTFLTSGCGSVLLLGGTPGAAVVSVRHVKSVIDLLPPMKVLHGADDGSMTLENPVDAYEIVCEARSGVTVREVASRMYSESPDRSEIERARRELAKLVKGGRIRESTTAGNAGATIYMRVWGTEHASAEETA